MRSTILGSGRHRLGLPGLIPVRHFVTVRRSSLLARLFGFGRRAGRHAFDEQSSAEQHSPALQTAAA